MEKIVQPWNLPQVKHDLEVAFEEDSERKLLEVLKENSFLFHELFRRKFGVLPVFREISFGGELRCDYAWLNDNSDGPEWILLEVESPKMKLFTKKNEPGGALNHAIEQVNSWRRYFDRYPGEKKRIFGAVSKFRYIIAGGDCLEWAKEDAARWRIDFHKHNNIEIHSSDVFIRPLDILQEHPGDLWSFAEHPKTLTQNELEPFWSEYEYMDYWRKILN